jgi:phosphohistidine swiveling domain-containing protein
MGKRLIGQVAFSIDGSYVAENARDIVLRGEWNQAIGFLRESLVGFTVEHATLVLSGEMTLDGNSNIGINLIEDKDSAGYIQTMKEVYLMDLFYESGTLYKFDRKVTSSEFKNMMERYHYKFDSEFTPEVQLQAVERYLSYGKNEKVFRMNSVEYIVAVPVDPNCYPSWFKRSDFNRSHQEFYRNYYGMEPVQSEKVKVVKETKVSEEEKQENKKFINRMVNQQNQSYMEGVAEDMNTSIETLSKELKEKVMQACKERNVTWENVTVFDSSDENKEKVISVPRELVIGYLSRDPSEWKPICESGLKMYNDSAWHSDLWLAMGHDLSSDAYDMDNAETSMFYQAIDHYRSMKLNKLADFSALNDIKMTSFEGRLVYEDSKNITDRDILVLPNAGLKYENIARKAGMVICETGGQISHLVIVGKEEMFPVILMKDAIRKLKYQYSIKVDFENEKIIGSYN